MSGLTCQQIVFACAERKSQRGLWLGLNAFAAYDLDRPIAFDHLICDSSAVDLRGISSIKVLRLRDIDLSEAALLSRMDPLIRSTTLARASALAR